MESADRPCPCARLDGVAPVAEWMRQRTSNPYHAGSNPAGGALPGAHGAATIVLFDVGKRGTGTAGFPWYCWLAIDAAVLWVILVVVLCRSGLRISVGVGR